MSDEFVDPVDSVPPELRVEGLQPGGRRQASPKRGASVEGEVVAVHRKSGHHEGQHVLDTSVGAKEYDEIVVRVESGDAHELAGKRVVIRAKTE